MFVECSPRVYAYLRRQCDAALAQDVVADAFLTAWRRRRDVPESALPWLLVVARNQLANRRRGDLRRDRVADTVARLADVARAGDVGAEQTVVERGAMLAALAELTELEREAVLLVAWDGLSNRDAAGVAHCSVRAFEVRLSRARARLTRAFAADEKDTPKGRVIA